MPPLASENRPIPSLSGYEQLGILAARFLHDFANHTSAFYGFTSLLSEEVTRAHPARATADQLSAAAERCAAALEEFSALRRALIGAPIQCPAAAAWEHTRGGLGGRPGWQCGDLPAELAGLRLAGEPIWLSFALNTVIDASACRAGSITFSLDHEESHDADAPPDRILVVLLNFAGAVVLDRKLWLAPPAGESAPLAVAREIVRRMGGLGRVATEAASQLMLRLPEKSA